MCLFVCLLLSCCTCVAHKTRVCVCSHPSQQWLWCNSLSFWPHFLSTLLSWNLSFICALSFAFSSLSCVCVLNYSSNQAKFLCHVFLHSTCNFQQTVLSKCTNSHKQKLIQIACVCVCVLDVGVIYYFCNYRLAVNICPCVYM